MAVGLTPRRGRSPMSRFAPLLAVVLVLCLGVAAGLALTRLTVRRDMPIGSISLGAWRLWPNAGNPDADPYRRARFAAIGQVPMATAEGLMFIARADDTGQALVRNCDYRVEGTAPPSHFWTLGVTDAAGFPISNRAGRFAFTSTDVVRSADGRFAVELSQSARPGNWLPVEGQGGYRVVLRLYDTLVSAYSARELRTLTMPAIARQACR